MRVLWLMMPTHTFGQLDMAANKIIKALKKLDLPAAANHNNIIL